MLKKVIVIAGANGLIGKKISSDLKVYGAEVIMADVLGDADGLTVYMDICEKESIKKVIKKTVDRFGTIDCFINCSYPRNEEYGRRFFEVEYKNFCENINMHIGGYFLAMQVFCDYFISAGRGNIINFASIYGVVAPEFEIYDGTDMTMPVEYAAIKSSIIHISKYSAKYLKQKNIRVNCVSVGGIFDNQSDKFKKAYEKKCINKGMLDVEDICGTVRFLVSEQSKYINGQNIIVDDGFVL